METSALKGRGMEDVVKTAIEAGKKGTVPATTLRFTDDVEEALAQVIDVAGAAIKGRHAAGTPSSSSKASSSPSIS